MEQSPNKSQSEAQSTLLPRGFTPSLLFNHYFFQLLLSVLAVGIAGFLVYQYFHNRPQYDYETKQRVDSSENKVANQAYTKELTEATAAVALPVTHTVKSGETLWSIAQQYYSSGFNWTDIKNANPQINAGKLEIGTQLSIPKVEAKELTAGNITPTITQSQNAPAVAGAMTETPPTELAQAPAPTPSQITGASYTVVHGDTLWSIAQRTYGNPYKWTEIAKANHLVHPNLIHRGNILNLPR